MDSLRDCFVLNDGNKIPCVGYGTFRIADDDTAYGCVREALGLGYRHIDTAFIYGNEKGVGKAINDSRIPRDEIFVTSKLWGTDRGYKSALEGFEKTMANLGLDYLDMFLIHWPANAKNFSDWQQINCDTWKAFEELKAKGRVRSIGLSNFLPHHILSILDKCTVKPAVDQIEMHPGYPQFDVVAFCKENDILVEAYRPLGRGEVIGNDEIVAMAAKYGKTPAQLAVRWALQHGAVPLPKSVHGDRMAENADVFDFEITLSDMYFIDYMRPFGSRGQHPDEADF